MTVWLPPDDALSTRIVERVSSTDSTCRCGTQLKPGSRVREVEGLPEELQVFLRGEVFCSLRCVRAFFLETLRTLEHLDSPAAELVVTDLRAIYFKTALAFALVLRQASEGTSGSTTQRN